MTYEDVPPRLLLMHVLHGRPPFFYDSTEQAELGLAEMAANKSAIHRLTNWHWISAILKT